MRMGMLEAVCHANMNAINRVDSPFSSSNNASNVMTDQDAPSKELAMTYCQ